MPVRLGAISKSRRWMWRNAETPCPVPKPWPAFREGSVALESIRREDSSCLQPCRLSSSEPRLRNSQPTQQTTNQQPTWTTGPYNSPETPSREPCSEPWPGRAEPRRPGAPGQLRSLHLAIPRMPPTHRKRAAASYEEWTAPEVATGDRARRRGGGRRVRARNPDSS